MLGVVVEPRASEHVAEYLIGTLQHSQHVGGVLSGGSEPHIMKLSNASNVGSEVSTSASTSVSSSSPMTPLGSFYPRTPLGSSSPRIFLESSDHELSEYLYNV